MYFIEICAHYLQYCLIRHKTGKCSNVKAQAAVIIFILVNLSYFCRRERKKINKFGVHKIFLLVTFKKRDFNPNYRFNHLAVGTSQDYPLPLPCWGEARLPGNTTTGEKKRVTQFCCL